ncbi:MAG: siderophore-interacting protein [Devosia sp.]
MEVINRTVERVRLDTRIRVLTVLAVTDLTPHMRRIRVGGPELKGFGSPNHADHIKLFFSADGSPLPRPELNPEGIAWPAGVPRPLMRDYTPRYFNTAERILDIDFVLHGDGPASTWASNARVGDELIIGGPRGSLLVPETFDWYLLVGDETALPAIGRRIEELLPTGKPVVAVIEVPEAADEQSFDAAPQLQVRWVHRTGLEAGAQNLLLPAVEATAFPEGVCYAFVAGEAQMSKALRQHLNERGLRDEYIRAPGYWTRGQAGDD